MDFFLNETAYSICPLCRVATNAKFIPLLISGKTIINCCNCNVQHRKLVQREFKIYRVTLARAQKRKENSSFSTGQHNAEHNDSQSSADQLELGVYVCSICTETSCDCDGHFPELERVRQIQETREFVMNPHCTNCLKRQIYLQISLLLHAARPIVTAV